MQSAQPIPVSLSEHGRWLPLSGPEARNDFNVRTVEAGHFFQSLHSRVVHPSSAVTELVVTDSLRIKVIRSSCRSAAHFPDFMIYVYSIVPRWTILIKREGLIRSEQVYAICRSRLFGILVGIPCCFAFPNSKDNTEHKSVLILVRPASFLLTCDTDPKVPGTSEIRDSETAQES
jgi:hypothetical protein